MIPSLPLFSYLSATLSPSSHPFFLLPFLLTAGPAKNNLHAGQLCGAENKGGSGGGEEVEGGGEEGEEGEDLVGDQDPTVFLLRQNVYAWYLAVSPCPVH